ncbi:MAG: hypothetical protein NTZ25_05570 [Candidatus Peregrinibacteria bacterium]|nr:hypothetical protein [Candidatus Peregrinibacteria bacterium]
MTHLTAENQTFTPENLLTEVTKVCAEAELEMLAKNNSPEITDQINQIRTRVFEIIQNQTETGKQLLKNVLGQIHGIPGKSVIRSKLIQFLTNLIQPPKPTENTLHFTLDDRERQEKSKAKYLHSSRQYPAAIAVLEEMITKNKKLNGNKGILGLLMCCYFKSGNTKKTIELGKRLLALDEKDGIQTIGMLAITFRQIGQWEECLRYAELGLKEKPDDVICIYLASIASSELNYRGIAETHILKLIDLNPDHPALEKLIGKFTAPAALY